MTEKLPQIFDLIGLLGFGVAIIGLIAAKPSGHQGSLFTRPVKWTFVFAWLIYAFICAGDILEAVLGEGSTDAFEGPVEMLFPIVILMGVFTAYSAQQYSDLRFSQMALNSSQTLMLQVLDQAPAGIVLIDLNGAILFANDCAKEVLELIENNDGFFSAPWMSGHDIKQVLMPVLADTSGQDIVLVFDWPGQRRLDLKVASQPMTGGDGREGGAIVTFVRP